MYCRLIRASHFRHILYWLLFLPGLPCLSVSAQAQSAATSEDSNGLVFATMVDFRPFTWQENGEQKGIDIDIIRLLSERLQVPITIRQLPWKRVLLYTKSGEVHGSFAGFRVPEREQFATFVSTPIHVSLYKIFVRKGSEFPYRTVNDLYGRSIGKNLGFRLSARFDQAVKDKHIRIVEDEMAENLQRVVDGRLEAVVGNVAEVRYTLLNLGLQDLVVSLDKPLRAPRSAYLMLSKSAPWSDHDAWLRRIDEALKSMKMDGTLDRIYRKYLHGDELYEPQP